MPKVFQIAYSGELMFTREALLKSRGYVVESALGNEAARKVLEAGSDDYHLFILGHAGSQEERQEMVRCLRQKFPKAKVLALNPPHASPRPDVDYNVALNGPEKWLAVVEEALG